MKPRILLALVALTVGSVAGPAFAEDLRTEGTRAFEERMSRLGELAREREDVAARIEESCLGRVVVGTRSGAVTGVLSPICQGLRNDESRLEGELRSGLTRAREEARRAGVYPGTIRTAIRRERLESFDD